MIAALALALGADDLTAMPLKVYLMAGQSNMQGHCKLTTFPYLAMDPETAPILKKMVNEDGTPRVIEKVWISSLGTGEEEKSGILTEGFGAARSGPRIGPELTFGIYMREHLGEPVLLIKTNEKKAAIDAFLKTVYTPEESKLMAIGVSNATYHYLGSAKIMARMGKAFADAMADISK
jgi:hypothetical protein